MSVDSNYRERLFLQTYLLFFMDTSGLVFLLQGSLHLTSTPRRRNTQTSEPSLLNVSLRSLPDIDRI